MHSVGASFTVVLPSAFVSLSSSLGRLPPVGRMRVISAGAWHNLVFWALVYASTTVRIGRVWNYLGWEDESSVGLSVIGVDEVLLLSKCELVDTIYFVFQDSPLAYHIGPGNIIVALDDIELRSNDQDPNTLWTQYLSEKQDQNPIGQGWCMRAADFFGVLCYLKPMLGT